MKVLIVAPFYPSDSRPYAGSYIKNQIVLLKKKYNIDFEVITFKGIVPTGLDLLFPKYKPYKSIPKFIKHDGIKVHFLSKVSIPRNIGMSVMSEYLYLILRNFIKKNNIQFDLIHSHFLYPTGEAAKRLAVETKKPLIITVHGTDINKYMKWNAYTERKCKQTLQYANKIITVSKNLEGKVKELEPKVKSQTIYNFVSEIFYNDEPKLTLSENKSIKVTFIGNLLVTKGVYELIEAFHLVVRNNNNIDISLNIVGSGSEFKNMQERIRELSLERKIFFWGAVDNKEIPKILKDTDIFVMPSYSEGLSLTTIEALSMGCPTIATKVGGIPEIIKHEENGLLIESKNIEMLYNSIQRLINEPELYNRVQKNTKKVYEQFSKDKILGQIFNTYSEAIARK